MDSSAKPASGGCQKDATSHWPKASERLVRSGGLGISSTTSRLADDTVRVLAAAARATHTVVATLGQLHAAGGRKVAEQAGQHQG